MERLAHNEDAPHSLSEKKRRDFDERGLFDNRRPQEIVPPDASCHLTDINSMKEATHTEDYSLIIQLKDM